MYAVSFLRTIKFAALRPRPISASKQVMFEYLFSAFEPVPHTCLEAEIGLVSIAYFYTFLNLHRSINSLSATISIRVSIRLDGFDV
jgi:hypothetical protein